MTSATGPRAALRLLGVLLLAVLGACSAAPGAEQPAAAPPAATAPPGTPVDPSATGVAPEPATRCEDPLGCYDEPERIGTFDAAAVPEASGLAAGFRNAELLYLLDDRPGTSEIWAVELDGTMVGALPVAGMDARDGESLALGRCVEGSIAACLFIGDVGDNLRNRDDVVVYRVMEPDLSAGLPADPLPADVARLRYPDGAHDAEAILVDDDGRVHIVTKAPFDRDTATTGEARLYRADAFADGVLTDLGPIPVPEPAFPVQSMFVGNVVTGGDHRNGRVLLRTYDQVLEYIAPEGERDLATLAEWRVREVPSAFERQSEALTWAADGCGYFTVGEVVGDIWRVRCRP